jgi:uncharacterized membrane protein (GlpM family)
MPFLVKLLITNAVIVLCVRIGHRYPSLGGLIATMPLTSLAVLIWLWSDHPGDYRLMNGYTAGVLWGIIPTVLFFVTALFCFRRELPLAVTLAASFATWLAGAALHQWFLGK